MQHSSFHRGLSPQGGSISYMCPPDHTLPIQTPGGPVTCRRVTAHIREEFVFCLLILLFLCLFIHSYLHTPRVPHTWTRGGKYLAMDRKADVEPHAGGNVKQLRKQACVWTLPKHPHLYLCKGAVASLAGLHIKVKAKQTQRSLRPTAL